MPTIGMTFPLWFILIHSYLWVRNFICHKIIIYSPITEKIIHFFKKYFPKYFYSSRLKRLTQPQRWWQESIVYSQLCHQLVTYNLPQRSLDKFISIPSGLCRTPSWSPRTGETEGEPDPLLMFHLKQSWDFPGGPGDKTLQFQCGGPEFDP